MEGKGEKIGDKEKEITGKWKMPLGDSKAGKEGEENKKKGRPSNVERLGRERENSTSSTGSLGEWWKRKRDEDGGGEGEEEGGGGVCV